VLAADLQDTEALGGLADINYSVGLVHKWSGDGPAAQAALERAVELAGPLVQRDPPNVRWQTTLFQSRRERNDVLLDPASLTPAALVAATARRLHDLEAERAFLEARSAGDPLNAKAKGMLQTIYIETGQVVAVRGLLGGDVRPALSEARAWFDRARQLADELARLDPALPHWARAPVQSSHLSSLLHWAQGDPRAALGELLSAWEARRGWLERRAAEALGDPARALELAAAEAEVGRLTVRLAEAGSSPSKALTRALSGFALRYGIPVELPGGPGGSTPPAAELEKALVWYERSRGRYRALAASRPDDPRRLGGLADSWQHTAYVFALLGRREAMDAASAEHAQVAGLLAARQPAPAPPASSAAGPPECSVWVTVRHVLYAQERVVLGRRAVSENALRFLVTPGPAEAGLMAQACLRQARLLQSLPMPEAKAEAKQVLGSAVAFLRAARPGGPPAELQPAITQIEAALRDTPGPG
jgi:hypothetical protein